MKRKWTTRIIGYILFAAFAIYLLFMIVSRTFEARKGKYQQKHISAIYKAKATDANQEELNFRRFLLENVSLNGGVIDLKPIHTFSVTEEEAKAKPEDKQIAFELRVYRVAFTSKNKITSGYILAFKSLKYREKKDGDFIDLMYKGSVENNIPSIMESGFEKHEFNQKLLKLGRIKLSLEFEPTPLLLKNDKQKGVAATYVSPSNIIFFADTASSLLTRSLTSKEKEIPSDIVARITTIKLSHVGYNAENKLDDKTETTLALITAKESEEKAPTKLTGLDLEYKNFKFTKEEIDAVKKYTKAKGADLVDLTDVKDALANGEKSVIRGIDLTKNFKEFNTQPILVTTGVILLILVAAYFLFAHRYVLEAVRKNKEQKAARIKEEENTKLNFEDAEVVEVTEASDETNSEVKEESTNEEAK